MQRVAIGLILLLTIGWYVYGGIVLKKWGWKIPNLKTVDLFNGCAPRVHLISVGKPTNWFPRGVKEVLDKL
jgi:hypothetical protein